MATLLTSLLKLGKNVESEASHNTAVLEQLGELYSKGKNFSKTC